MTKPAPIRIAAAILTRRDTTMLVVRKRGTHAFMQPGGKIEPGEEPAVALCRELAEELGLTVTPDELFHVGRFDAPAANEPGHVVDAEVFSLRTDASIEPRAEIDEAVWIDPASPADLHYAPLTRDHLIRLVAKPA
ncbi:MAG: NUDIX domain-containing protein [Oricola sp.]|nr:NUDIX domain-containing protein [Oricola sp.]MCI5073496.1 NUDIX domain-containing protein [Oricola sp.]